MSMEWRATSLAAVARHLKGNKIPQYTGIRNAFDDVADSMYPELPWQLDFLDAAWGSGASSKASSIRKQKLKAVGHL